MQSETVLSWEMLQQGDAECALYGRYDTKESFLGLLDRPLQHCPALSD